MNRKREKIIRGLSSNLQEMIPQFKKLKENANEVLNQSITQDIEEKMTDDQKEILKGARNAFNLKDMGLDEKLEELTKIMKKCQHG